MTRRSIARCLALILVASAPGLVAAQSLSAEFDPAAAALSASRITAASADSEGGGGQPVAPAPVAAPASGAQAQAPAPAAASDSIVLAQGKVRIGAVLYTDWAYYAKTGFGPQFVTQTNFPGPDNDNFSTFDVHRTYLNLFFMPTDWVTFRFTPNLFREIGNGTADKFGKTGGAPSSEDGNLALRVKYAYLEFGKIFDKSAAFKGTNFRFGQQMNPLIDWEEALIDYRFVTLVPWNYLSLSSTQVGAALNGAVKANGKQYLDFQIGLFNQASFHAFEQAETKQFMVRGSVYPMGAASRFQGLGITGFYNRGTSNAAPDTGTAPVTRIAALVHYATKSNGAAIVAEYDSGKNALSVNNMFSGSEPQDLLGVGTTAYAAPSALWSAALAGTQTKQRGYYVFGRANVPNTGVGFFGYWHYFQPNTNVADNPLDFDRTGIGVAYRFNRNLRFAVSNQNVLYRRSQFTYPVDLLATLSPSLATAHPTGIDNAVPPSIKAIFASFEFTF